MFRQGNSCRRPTARKVEHFAKLLNVKSSDYLSLVKNAQSKEQAKKHKQSAKCYVYCLKVGSRGDGG